MQIDDSTKGQLAANESQLEKADTIEKIILCNIIINSNEIREYFFGVMDSKFFFVKPFYSELYKIIQNEIMHNKPVNFTLLENNLRIQNKTDILLLKQFSEQTDSIFDPKDLWVEKAKILFETHQLLYSKAHLIQNIKDTLLKINNINNKQKFDEVITLLSSITENHKGGNLNFDESQVNITEDKNIKDIIQKMFTEDSYLPTGFYNYDSIHKGIPLGSLFMMAATTGAGKSMVALNLALNVFSSGRRVCLVSLEMTEVEIMKRAACIISNNIGTKTKTTDFLKEITPEFINNIKNNFIKYKNNIISKNPEACLHLRCKDNDLPLDRMLLMLKKYKYDLIIIDYIGLLNHSGKSTEQWQQLSIDARNAKIFAQENNNVVLLLAQRERDNDVSFSKSLIQHSNVFWIWEKIKEEETDSDFCKRTEDEAEFITTFRILKNRNASQKPFNLKLNYATMTVNGGSEDIKDAEWKIPAILNKVSKKEKKIEYAKPGTSDWD